MESTAPGSKHLTILLPGGLLEPEVMGKVAAIAARHNLTFYLTTAQNLRLLGARDDNLEQVREELAVLGLTLKAPGLFPRPRVCVGTPYCNLGLADTFALSERILACYGGRTGVKPKYKISISGCPANCGGALQADIGIVATRRGYDLYVGGKGGPLPRVGRKIASGLTAEEIVEAVGRLADYHAAMTPAKLRLYKLLDQPGFPFVSQENGGSLHQGQE